MVVAVAAVRVVKVPVDEIIDVVSVWNGFMSAVGPVNMPCFVSAAGMPRSTVGGIRCIHRNRMFVHVIAMGMVEVPVVKVVDVVAMLHCLMATVSAVHMVVVLVFIALLHRSSFYPPMPRGNDGRGQ